MEYSKQQKAVIESQGNMVVNAVAGSGKTSTLIGYTQQRASDRMLYLAFNKSVKQEAVQKFRTKGLRNVRVETAHALAFNHFRSQRLNIAKSNYQAFDARQILQFKLKDAVEDMRFGRHVLQLVNKFCNSPYQTVQEVPYFDLLRGEEKAFIDRYSDRLLLNARLFLAKMDKGEIPISHDFYLKKYQLTQPDLSNYQYILFDEGQDASPVMLDIFLKQKGQKVIVGDEHQQIYGWRHAVNALANSGFKRRNLDTSYRFDQHIGDLAKAILSTKNHIRETPQVPIKGRGVQAKDPTRATLGRTNNAILVDAIQQLIDEKWIKSVYFEGNFNSYTYADEGGSVFDVLNLYLGNRQTIRDPMIKAFQDFGQLEEYMEKSKDASLSGVMDIVKKYGRDLPRIIKTIKDKHVPDEQKSQADMIYSTVHKAKGMEYGEVTLLNDFLGEERMKELLLRKDLDLDEDKVLEDINVLYVAVTRTTNRLIIPDTLVPASFRNKPGSSIEILKTKDEVLWDDEFEQLSEDFDLLEGMMDERDRIEVKVETKAAAPFEKASKKHPKAYRGWTNDEDKALEKMYRAGKKTKELATYFMRSKGAIRSRLKKIGLTE